MKIIGTAAFVFCGLLLSTPASAVSFNSAANLFQNHKNITEIQYTRGGSREFRRCMRAKYGPRYFSRVPRAHRFHMAQACSG